MKLAKNTVYVVVIWKASDSFNTYGKVVNAFKITHGKRKSILKKEFTRLDLLTTPQQMAEEYLKTIGFEVPDYHSEKENLLVVDHTVTNKQLKAK